MRAAPVKYDPQTDILRLRFGDTAIEERDPVEASVIVGCVVGLELLDSFERLASRSAAETEPAYSEG